MITNERQHRITRAEINRFEQAIASAVREATPANVDPRLHAAMIDGLRSQLDELRQELREYEALREGKITGRALTSLLDLPRALVEGRIAARLTQRQLGAKLGIAEQQVQRYEQTGYSGASIERLQQVADALGLTIHQTVRYHLPQRSKLRATGPRRKTATADTPATTRRLASTTTTARAKRAAPSSASKDGNVGAASVGTASAAGEELASKPLPRRHRQDPRRSRATTDRQRIWGPAWCAASTRTVDIIDLSCRASIRASI
jgi:transcriptional regulator with XRE-family HTH domain